MVATQTLSYPIRLPDPAQEDALRLLEVSRAVINATVTALWPQLDAFGTRETSYAYQQVTALIAPHDPHGDRQWRCEAEQAGRILRAQAQRKQQFARILPLLSAGMIASKTEKQPAGKNRKAIKQALAGLREDESDGGSEVELQGLIEQCCTFYLHHERFPACYEEMQRVPVLNVGILPYAGDDGGDKGQAYHLHLDPQKHVVFFAFRFPDEAGTWTRTWAQRELALSLPDPVVQRLREGAALAPTLREIREPDGTRYAVLDFLVEVPAPPPAAFGRVRRVLGFDWGVRTLVTATVVDLSGNRLSPPLFLDTGGFDGRQAHTRKQIDALKKKVATLEQQRDRFPVGDTRREPSEKHLAALRQEIACCWRKYQARNEDLAHLAANLLCRPGPRCQTAGLRSLAALFRLRLEWGQGLRCRHQHRALRGRLPAAATRPPGASHAFHASDHADHTSQLGFLHGSRAGETRAANVPSGPPPVWRKEVCQRLDQISEPAFRVVPRQHASLVRIAARSDRLIHQDTLLSNGRNVI